MEYFNYKKLLTKEGLKQLFCCVVLGLLLTAIFLGKKSMELTTIAVSPSEQYVAFNEFFNWLGKSGRCDKIRCFQTDGTFAFEYVITADISAGGTCTLWFDEDVLCVLFYRTDKVLRFAMDGTILDTVSYTAEENPPEFPSFNKNGHQYVYNGKTIDVIYDKRGFIGYWFFNAERYLKILPKNGEEKIIWTGAIA